MDCTKKCPMCRQTPTGCETRLFRNGFFYPLDKYLHRCRECNCAGVDTEAEQAPSDPTAGQQPLFDA